MSEVLRITSEIILLMGLFYFAYFDYQTGLIDGKAILLFSSFGMVLQLMFAVIENKEIKEIFLSLNGMLIGIAIWGVAVISKEAIGKGDALLFLATGTFLDIAKNSILLCGTLWLVGSYAMICFIRKKKGKKDKIALAPFVLIAFVVFIL